MSAIWKGVLPADAGSVAASASRRRAGGTPSRWANRSSESVLDHDSDRMLAGCWLGSPQTICFVSREDFLGEDEQGLAAFGIDRVVWPEAQLASDIEQVIRTPDALDAESFADGAGIGKEPRNFRRRGCGGNVVVEGRYADNHIADTAAGQEGAKSGVCKARTNAFGAGAAFIHRWGVGHGPGL